MTPSDVLIKKLTQHSNLAPADVSKVRHLTCMVRELSSNEDFIHQGALPRASAIVVKGMLARLPHA